MSKYYYIFTIAIALFLSGTANAATITSIASGTWGNTGTWDSGTVPGASDDVIIAAGHIVSVGGTEYGLSLTVNATGTIDVNNKKKLYILGDITLNGNYADKGHIFLLGYSSSIDGTGTISGAGTFRIEAGTKTILPTANLNMAGVIFDLNSSGVINNQGYIVCLEISGTDNSSVWTNETGASVAVLQDLLLGPEKGVLVSSATNSTVTYKGTADQSIFATTYYNLIIDNVGYTATLLADVIVSNNLTITSGTLETDALNDFNITLSGSWSNSGTFNENLGTVTLNGTGTQTITNASGELFYNLYLNNPSGSTALGGNVTVSNTFTMSGGNVASSGNVFELGTSITNQGTLVRTAGEIIGTFKRWVTTTAMDILFPIQTASSYYGATLNFTNLTPGSMQINFVQSDPGNTGLSLFESSVEITDQFTEGYWTLTPADGLWSNDYDIQVEAAAPLFDDYTIGAATRLMYRVNSGSAHTLTGTHQSGEGGLLFRNALTSASGEISIGHTNCIPPVPTGLTGTAEVCTSQTSVGYSLDLTVGSTYTWTITGGAQASGGTTNSITVDWGTTGGPGLVSLVEDEAGGCSSSEAIEYDVTIYPVLLSISGPTMVCTNGTETYSVDNTSGSTYTWVITGGTQASGGTTNSITVDWGSGGTGSVKVTETTGSCGDGIQETLVVSIDYLSAASGNWGDVGTWVGGVVPSSSSCATIQNGHSVKLMADEYINTLSIATGGTMEDGNKNLYVSGDITFDGDWDGGGMGQVIMTGDGSTIAGTGTITGKNKLQISSGTYTISSTATFAMDQGTINLLGGATVINNGNITTVEVTGMDATSVWTQGSTGTINIDTKLFGVGNGTLNANTTGNTINYNQTSGDVLVFATSYYNLTINKTGRTATLEGNTTVLNNLTVTNGTFDTDAVNNYSISVGGNWSNSATFNENTSTITLSGTADQTISNAEQFYNLIVNKSSGTLNISADVIASNALTMTSGNISTGANKLTLGTSTVNVGSLTCTSGNVIGQFERWINATGTDIVFPLGTASNSNKLTINFTALGTSGSLITQFIATDPGSTGMPYFESPVNVTAQFTEGYWKTTAANSLASTDYNINLLANGFTSYAIASPTRLCTRVSAGVGWFTNVDGTHGSASGSTVYRTNCTGGATREFGLGTSDCTAPVTSAITGDNDVCTNDLAEAYSVTNTIGSTYTWTITGGAQASGGTTNSITVNWGSTGMTDGDVQVVETVACGDGDPVNLTVEIGPTTDTILGTDTVAENSSGVVYSVGDNAGSTYNWTVTGGGTITSGDGTYTINVDWTTAQTGNVRVAETDAVCGAGGNIDLPIEIMSTHYTLSSGNWTNGGTWNLGVAPGADSYVEISAGHTVTMDGDPGVCYGLEIKGSALWATNLLTTDVGLGGINVFSGGDVTDINKTGVLTTTGDLVLNESTNGIKVKVVMQTTGGQSISGSGSIANLAIDATTTNNGTLTVRGALSGISTLTNAANQSLSLGGTVSIIGLDASASGNTVTYNGVSAQTVSGISPFCNLTIDNAAGATLGSATTVTNVLTVSQGVFAMDNTLTLQSNASGTASLAEMTTGSVTGNLDMQRYLSIGSAGWRDLSSPITGSTISDWMPNIVTMGFTGATCCSPGWVSMYTFDESKDNEVSAGWQAATNVTNPTTSRGVSSYIGSESGTLSVIGTPNQGTQVFNSSSSPAITFTQNSSPDNPDEDGFNYIGNPYPCNINWEKISPADMVNINDNIWIYNTTNGSFGVYNGTINIGTEGVDSIIPSSQGFFIHANANPTLTLRESHKDVTPHAFIKSIGLYNQSFIKLGVSSSINSYSNEAVVVFMPDASEVANDASDVVTMASYEANAPCIYTHSSDSINLTLNTVPDNVLKLRIPMTVKVGVSGTYDIDVKQLSLPEISDVFLVDKTTNDSINLKNTQKYSCNILNTEGEKRFDLSFSILVTDIEDDEVTEESTASLFPNPVKSVSTLQFANENQNKTTIAIYNEIGQKVRTIKHITDNEVIIERGNLSSGIYFVKINVKGQGQQQVSFIIPE